MGREGIEMGSVAWNKETLSIRPGRVPPCWFLV